MSLSQINSSPASDNTLFYFDDNTADSVTLLPREWADTPADSDSTGQLLPRKAIFYYGVGHMLNDLTAACWFTYLLIFLTDIGLSPSEAAFVMLSGQLADGVATIFVGSLIDKYGHYKLWYAGGCVLVAVSFSSVFGGCWACKLFGTSSRSANTIAYSVFAAIFNIGWAATQVSHMSLVNCLSSNASSRVALTSCRNAFNMVANLCLYAIAFVIFRAFPSKDSGDIEKQFQYIAQVSVLFGFCFIAVFFFGVKEPRLAHLVMPMDCPKVWWVSWFKKALYYQVAFVYVATRLATNVSQAFLAFYLIDDLNMRDSTKAVVPATIYVSSFLVSLGLQELGGWTGSRIKSSFAMGSTLWMIAGAMIYFLNTDTCNWIYVSSIIIGIANALMTVTAVSMQGFLVGVDLSGCAFVYGSLSFLEKVSGGIALYMIEAFNNANTPDCTPKVALGRPPCHTSMVRLTLTLIPGGCALLALCVTLLMDFRSALSIGYLEEPLLSTKESTEEQPLALWETTKGAWKKLIGRFRSRQCFTAWLY